MTDEGGDEMGIKEGPWATGGQQQGPLGAAEGKRGPGGPQAAEFRRRTAPPPGSAQSGRRECAPVGGWRWAAERRTSAKTARRCSGGGSPPCGYARSPSCRSNAAAAGTARGRRAAGAEAGLTQAAPPRPCNHPQIWENEQVLGVIKIPF